MSYLHIYFIYLILLLTLHHKNIKNQFVHLNLQPKCLKLKYRRD